MTDNAMTTAELLGQYRRDLKAQGFTDDEAFSLVRRVAHEYAREGITVSSLDRHETCAEHAKSCDYKVNHRPEACPVAAAKAYRALQELFVIVTRKGGE